MKFIRLQVLIILISLFSKGMFPQTQMNEYSQRMVFVTYDFSGSMQRGGKLYGPYVSASDIDEWNTVLSEVLFGRDLDLRRFKSAKIIGNNNASIPVARQDDFLTFAEIREKTTAKLVNYQNSSWASISAILPKRIQDFNGKFTDIAHAEYEFLKLAELNENPVWVCLSDQQQSVGTSRGGGQNYLDELVNLRYKLPTVPVLTIQLKEDVYLIVRKLSIDEKGTYLSLNIPDKKLLFVQSAENPMVFYTSGTGMMLQPNRDVISNELKDVKIWFKVFDAGNKFVDSIQFRVTSFPGTFDSLIFREPIKLLDLSKKGALKLIISARYIYNGRLVTQELASSDVSAEFHAAGTKSVSSKSSKSLTIVWIILILSVSGGIFAFAYFKYLKKSNKFTFQAEQGGVKLTPKYFEKIKEKQIIRLGSQQATTPTPDCYEIHCPGYSVKYEGDNSFLLMKGEVPEKPFKTGQKVTLFNSEGLNVALTIFEKQLKSAVGTKPLFNPTAQKTNRRF